MESIFIEELKVHNGRNDCWIAIENEVYNITDYLEEHPGGMNILLDHAGTDATNDFIDIGHSQEAIDLLKKYHIYHLNNLENKRNVNKNKNCISTLRKNLYYFFMGISSQLERIVSYF